MKSMVDNVDCSICGCSKYDQVYLKKGFLYVECVDCNHVFVRNRLKEDALLDMYSSSEIDKLDRKINQSDQRLSYWGKVYRKYIDYLKSLNISNKNLLDVGTGTAEFLIQCKNETDFNIHGLDFSEDTLEFNTSLVGEDNYYYRQKIEDIDFDRKFGVISLWGVLEHVTDPVAVFKKCYDVLEDDGVLIALIPNIKSHAIKILGVNTPTLNPRAHINFFTDKSIEVLCQKSKMELKDMFQELPVIDLMYPHINYNSELINSIVRKKESYYYVAVFKKVSDSK